MVKQIYNARGLLASVATADQAALGTWTYDANGHVAAVARANGVGTTYAYDDAGQLTEVAHKKGTEALALARYTIDAAGRRTAQTREDGITEKYGYDATSQLTSVDYGLPVGSATSTSNLNPAALSRSEAFSYDSVGNRTQALSALNSQRSTTAYTTNALNEYTKVAGAVFAYDANGNLVDDGKQTYSYDAQNRLISVGPSVSSTPSAENVRADFFYDARNRCVLRRYYTKGSQNQWVLDNANSLALTYDTAWNLLAERTLDGAQVGTCIHGARTDEILRADLSSSSISSQSRSSLVSSFPLGDGLGSTVALADAHGFVTQRYRYDAYGTPHIPSTDYRPLSTGSAYGFLFTGREWLNSVQLNGHRNRYYSPSLGRWLSRDPILFSAGDANFYRYTGNDPVNKFDPDGLNPCQSGVWGLYYDSCTIPCGCSFFPFRIKTMSCQCWFICVGDPDSAMSYPDPGSCGPCN